MTRNQINIALAAILGTLAAIPSGEAPSGILFAALQAVDAQLYTLDAHQMLVQLLVSAKLATLGRDHMVTITTAGRLMAVKCEAARAS